MSSSTQRHFAANSKYYLIILSLVTAHGSETLVQLVCVVCEDLQQLQAGFCILITGQINPQLCIGAGGWGVLCGAYSLLTGCIHSGLIGPGISLSFVTGREGRRQSLLSHGKVLFYMKYNHLYLFKVSVTFCK